jgi:hypothetical protein
MTTIAERARDKLVELEGLMERVAARLAQLDRKTHPGEHSELALVLDDLMGAAAGLRALLPEPQPGNDGAKYVQALDYQREQRSRRAELAESIIDCERAAGPDLAGRGADPQPASGPLLSRS